MTSEQNRFKVFKNRADLKLAFKTKSIRQVRLGDKKFCIAHQGSEYFAFEALCPHQKQPLVSATMNHFGEIICPLHFYRFNLKTGQEASRLCNDLAIFPLEYSDDGIFVKLY
ncbi:Rieske (2Fe-2S) protein [Roseivirga sp.]|uniref:Rieske (2Fe-2S) protein n=1 Tax=Roseivirga sp. TaxID=1964215 RepID=UPI003B8B4B2D